MGIPTRKGGAVNPVLTRKESDRPGSGCESFGKNVGRAA